MRHFVKLGWSGDTQPLGHQNRPVAAPVRPRVPSPAVFLPHPSEQLYSSAWGGCFTRTCHGPARTQAHAPGRSHRHGHVMHDRCGNAYRRQANGRWTLSACQRFRISAFAP